MAFPSHTRALAALGAAALLAAPGIAGAQSNITLYGVVDTGIEYVSHASPNGAVWRMPGVTGELPSRWGLRGSEDLGGGLAAIFQLESGFNIRGGDLGQGGRMFGRQAFVGVKGPYGTLALGRQYSMTYYALLGSDVLGPDIYGMGSFDAYIPNARTDNSVTYQVGWQGLSFGVGYSFGRDSGGTGNSPGQGTCAGQVPGQAVQCRDWSVMLKYDASNFGVAASYEEQRGGTNASANFFDGQAPSAFNSSSDKDARATFGAYYKYGAFKLGGGWLGRRVSTAAVNTHSNLFYLGAAYNLTPAWLVDGEVYRIINNDHDTRGTMTTLRATYSLSVRTAVYAQAAYLFNSARAAYSVSGGGGGTTPPAGQGQTGVMLGMRHTF
ncbi:porin [Pandoraea communis]|uniref:Membrane protein n=1 Tax=Pandoraea communis TaxID=2508297 RepID=A0A5E4X2E4_9BURK|nr:porin [Pandoraea communis]MDM8358577.1 porin [Pandoraea communis]VVE30472.1 membrane protein [Pandoraea communis]